MTTIRASFLQIRALFFQFLKKGRGYLPSPPSSYAPVHQFGWLSERGGNFLNLLQKEGVPRKGRLHQKTGGEFPTLEETMVLTKLH